MNFKTGLELGFGILTVIVTVACDGITSLRWLFWHGSFLITLHRFHINWLLSQQTVL